MVFIRNQDSVLFNKSSSVSIIQVKSHLVSAHVGGSLYHVVSVPSGDGDEGHSGGVVPDLDKCNMSATISIQYYSCNY